MTLIISHPANFSLLKDGGGGIRRKMRVRVKNMSAVALKIACDLRELTTDCSLDDSNAWVEKFAFLNALTKWLGLKFKVNSPEGRTLSVPAEKF